MAALVLPNERRLARRLRPLMVAISLQWLLLWVPIEKLFLTEIGFRLTRPLNDLGVRKSKS